MPNYGTVGHVQSLFPAISSVTALSSAIVSKYIDDTEAEINARIAKRYTVPVVVTSGSIPILVAITERETIYRIATQRGLIQFPAAQQAQHPLQVQHREDQQLLKEIVEGEMQLVDSSGNNLSLNSGIQIYSTTKDYIPTGNEGLDFTEVTVDSQKNIDAVNDRQGRQ